jgi:protein CpxP
VLFYIPSIKLNKLRRSNFMSKCKIALIVIGALFGIGLAVFLGGRAYFMSLSPEQKAEKFASHVACRLSMTDDQKGKFNGIVKSVVDKMKPYHNERSNMKSDIISIIRSESFDKKRVEALADKKMKDMQELRPFMIEKIAEVHAILTPEQKEKLIAMLEKHHRHFGHFGN